MTTSSLLKSDLHNSIAEGLYNEIVNRTARYYYFLGRTLTWEDDLEPPYPIDSYAYELLSRNEMITLKEIKPTDVAFVIPRYNWASNTVYDQYDDQYSKEVQGFNLTSGGTSYGSAPYVWVGSAGSVTWTASTVVLEGAFLKTSNGNGGFIYFVVSTAGTTGTTAPTHTDGTQTNGTAQLTHVSVSDGGGSGAAAYATVLDGRVIDITMTSRGINYTSAPSVHIAGGGGNSALAEAVVTVAPSGVQTLQDSVFYVITDEYNVYACLDNNNRSASTYKPVGTTIDPSVYPDGYMWKFMYNVPIALRTKFLTDEYIPVITALRNQFYSSGSIQTIRVDQAGSGYTTGSITVQGDGFLEADPIYLIGDNIVDGGTGYTDPTLSIESPFTNVSSWFASTAVFLGQRISYNNNIYEVAVAGTTGTVAPTHRYNIVANGTAALKYLGTTATGSLTLTGDEITGVTLNGIVREIQITNNGSGYTSPPTVNFSGGGGSGATAIAVLQGGSVIRVIVTDGGDDYTSEPTVTFGTIWTETTAVTIGQQIYYSNRLYTVTTAGTTGSSAPVHLSGAATNGTATLTYAGVTATGLAPLKFGAGYSAIPSVTVTDLTGAGANITINSTKSEAKLVPLFSDGQLTGVQIDDGGIGYTYATLSVTGDGSGATISPDFSPGDIDTLQANIELLTVDGRIMNIPVVSQGWGYAAAVVTITGDGTGAEATAEIVNGAITKINITNYGQGYRWATVTITGNGYGAKARAIISPYGGHGKYSIDNLFARTLMFFTNISGDTNQGFVVNNDYRQLGILKNPRQYSTTNNLTLIAASGCWVISGSISTTFFPVDSLITESVTGRRFRIVTNNGSAILAQSLDNFAPSIGTTFVNAGGFTFTASAVTPPTVDKYSGDLLFIDNRQGFTPTLDQSVTLRTVIRF